MLYICYIYHALHVVHSDIDVARCGDLDLLSQHLGS